MGAELEIPFSTASPLGARVAARMKIVFSITAFLALTFALLQQLPAPPPDGEPNPVRVTHGPILGKPTATSMSLWFRTQTVGSVEVFYGTDRDNLDQASKPVTTVLEDDNTGVLTLDGLEPDTKYFYRVADHQEAGYFRTLKRAEEYGNAEYNPEGKFNFRFEFACGNNQTAGGNSVGPHLPTFDTLNKKPLRDSLDFAILNGDWLYEFERDYAPERWLHQVGIQPAAKPRVVDVMPTITGVWENYKIYLTRGKNLSEWHRHVPTFYTYDDHETINDIYGTAEVGYVNRRAVFRDIGVQAWYDYLAWANPQAHNAAIHFGRAEMEEGSDVLTDPDADFTKLNLEEHANLHVHWGTPTAGVPDAALDAEPGDPNSKVYEIVEVLGANQVRINPPAAADGKPAYSIGRRCYGKWTYGNSDFFFIDTRSHRDLHDVENPTKPGASMLGKQQLKWLKDGITASEADFIFVVSSVNFMVPHVGSGGGDDKQATVKKDDAWTVFLEEREELIQFWDKLDQPVFVLTADLHNSFAIKVTDNVWEFASGPHNSINHAPQDDEGDRPSNGKFKYGPRECDIRWSSYALNDIPRAHRTYPHFCVVQINNVFNNPVTHGDERWVAFPHPQVIFQFFDGFTGELRYSETIVKGL
ncbi:MAG: alkaline phosphatase D [Verrucomicrobiales bacterium]